MNQTLIPYFAYSFGILMREGLEAMLVVVALVAGARQMRDGSGRVREVYVGSALALSASLMLAWAIHTIISDNTSDALEGVFQLFAAGTLFYVSSWLTGKSQAKHWNDFIFSNLRQAERRSLPYAFGFAAFVAVLREGGETIVFFQALFAGTSLPGESRAIWAGLIAAALVLVGAFFTLESLLTRIPLRLFFQTTSVLLYALAIVFVGQGVASLQEAEVLGASFVPHFPSIQFLGFYPTVQGLVGQGGLLLAAVIFWLVTRPRRARSVMMDQAKATMDQAKAAS